MHKFSIRFFALYTTSFFAFSRSACSHLINTLNWHNTV